MIQASGHCRTAPVSGINGQRDVGAFSGCRFTFQYPHDRQGVGPADRLSQLEADGLIEKTAYQTNPVRFEYRLTDNGRSLLPVLLALCRWAARHFPSVGRAPTKFMQLGLD